MYAIEYRNSGVLLFSEEDPKERSGEISVVELEDDFTPDPEYYYQISEGKLIQIKREITIQNESEDRSHLDLFSGVFNSI